MSEQASARHWQRWAVKAARAPSAHNTQPARWHIDSDIGIYLFENLDSQLKAADPQKRDHYIGLGAAFEGLCIAASEDGFELEPPAFNCAPGFDYDPARHSPVAFTCIRGSCSPDALAPYVARRATYRGKFMGLHRGDDPAFRAWAKQHPNIVLLEEANEITQIADWYDRCAYEFAKKEDCYAELYRWLRFNDRHPDWARDGLSADALGMGSVEKGLGAYIAHPTMFRLWKRLGLGKLFVSEKAAIQSANYILIFICDRDSSAFDTGRRFYRLWLEMAAMGFALCPMSALADHPWGQERLCVGWDIPADRHIVNVLRVGVAPKELPQPAARLPDDELFI